MRHVRQLLPFALLVPAATCGGMGCVDDAGTGFTTQRVITGRDPSFLQGWYQTQGLSTNREMVTIVPGGDSALAQVLQGYRSQFLLGTATLQVFDQQGGSNFPPDNPTSVLASQIGTQLASAIAPSAKHLEIQANSASGADLFAALQVAMTRPVGTLVHVTWNISELDPNVQAIDALIKAHPGIRVVTPSGDATFAYPSTSQAVLGVAGTDVQNGSEIAWSGGHTPCSVLFSRPTFQPLDPADTCTNRAGVDSAALAKDLTYFDGTTFTSISSKIGASAIQMGLIGIQAANGPLPTMQAVYQLPTKRDLTSGVNADGKAAHSAFDSATGIGATR